MNTTNMSAMSMSMDTNNSLNTTTTGNNGTDQSSLLFHSSTDTIPINTTMNRPTSKHRFEHEHEHEHDYNENQNNENQPASTTSTTAAGVGSGAGAVGDTTTWGVEEAKVELRQSVQILSHRGLKLASRWAAEQLIGLADADSNADIGVGGNMDVTQTEGEAGLRNKKRFDFQDAATGTANACASAFESECTAASARMNKMIQQPGNDLELYAKSIFDLGEYHRAAAVLSANPTNVTKSKSNSYSKSHNRAAGSGQQYWKNKAKVSDLANPPPKQNLTSYGIYLRAYALYMAGERRKEEEILELRDPLERTTVQNVYLSQLLMELSNFYNHSHSNQNNNHESDKLDPFGLYVYGIILKEIQKTPSSITTTSLSSSSSTTSTSMKNTTSPRTTIATPSKYHHHGLNIPSAYSILIQSLILYPYNWSAWLDLAELCISDTSIHSDVEELLKPISDHWMYHFFCVHLFLENQANENAIMVMERLLHGTTENFNNCKGFFVKSPYLQSQLAVAYYNMRDFDTAQAHFAMSKDRDVFRLDQMDVYSNILYVKEDKVALSSLAHHAIKLDKYRPETCCIVGNYYSLKAQHEKAVQYFQRALKLDRSYLSAWTLMGHEYLEMKNTAAAIEAYRRAVDINPRDYRAWYGLGQTYEIMNMLLYALFYYRKAVELRPYDARMWCAMGGCYLSLDRRNDAMRSYERAVANHDAEGIATKKLAMLYREDGDTERAARCYLRHLELRYQSQLNQSSISLDSEDMNVRVVISSVNVDEPEAEALLHLASYHRDHGEFEMAILCCERLLDYPGPEKEEAKVLLREIRSIID